MILIIFNQYVNLFIISHERQLLYEHNAGSGLRQIPAGKAKSSNLFRSDLILFSNRLNHLDMEFFSAGKDYVVHVCPEYARQLAVLVVKHVESPVELRPLHAVSEEVGVQPQVEPPAGVLQAVQPLHQPPQQPLPPLSPPQ